METKKGAHQTKPKTETCKQRRVKTEATPAKQRDGGGKKTKMNSNELKLIPSEVPQLHLRPPAGVGGREGGDGDSEGASEANHARAEQCNSRTGILRVHRTE